MAQIELEPKCSLFGNKAAFGGIDAGGKTGLWIRDGTVAGTTEIVAGHHPGGINPPTSIVIP
jgi:hypothetical protein